MEREGAQALNGSVLSPQGRRLEQKEVAAACCSLSSHRSESTGCQTLSPRCLHNKGDVHCTAWHSPGLLLFSPWALECAPPLQCSPRSFQHTGSVVLSPETKREPRGLSSQRQAASAWHTPGAEGASVANSAEVSNPCNAFQCLRFAFSWC